MPIRKEPTGRRSVQVEVEVSGSPEEVWRAIATAPESLRGSFPQPAKSA
jgi:hypothetical protein